ncbi:MspA family porin [Nocardia terpenica]|uniref:MspA family protein n=1 Tax=Nocardia terpenica TaxID=455432 RepID=A0A164JP10_9NOCA|nr:MspA family porin [Nocardia terpenica]KZM70586.1 mspA family protein [Nocardia terpenica]MBF6060356.1 MspA family porin [Nocardia terpenica]MBF6103616.1 MspA family porin [Nocardia terpenica]MBF6112010.1 MspA family porin [Nocardia terpenica]MBF6117837.1 MspA family porin [Nocardia terpenica]
MSENRTSGLRRGARFAGIGAAAAVAIGLFSTGAANADTFVPLPDGQKLGPNGVVITRTDEHALISPSLADNGAGRTVWVSGNAAADVPNAPEGTVGPNNGQLGSPGTNNSSTHGASQINTGYIVGCQVNIAQDAISAGVSGGISLTGANASGSIGLNLGPGQVKFVQIDSKDITKPGHYSVEYQDAEMQIQGCAGYAQARAYTVVEVIGDNYSKTTLYGQPFSIG